MDVTRGRLGESDQFGDSHCEAARTEHLARYKKMYDRSSALARIGVWECELATEELMWTDGVYDLFELPRGSRIERSEILKMYEEESRKQMESLRAEAIATGGSFSLDINIRTAKGNLRWLRLTADVEEEHGRPVRIFGTKQDITQEVWAQERVRSLQTALIHLSRGSAMGTMAETLAHELNQPLTAITSYASGTRRLLTNGEDDRKTLESSLTAIEANAFRASQIIRSMRAMIRGGEVERRRINPDQIIREAGALALVGTDDRISLRYLLATDAFILVDPIQIQQVLINLIKNSADAVKTSPERQISVSTSVTAGFVTIKVEDTGSGLPEGPADSLFEFFVSSKPEGMGVGLSISRTIVEAHHGRIYASNRADGGACFCVELPYAADCDPDTRRDARAADDVHADKINRII